MSWDERTLAYAYLSRVFEAGSLACWDFVNRVGPLEAAARIRSRLVPEQVLSATESRCATALPEQDLDAAAAVGARLVTPDSEEWPHFALGALTQTGRRRLAGWRGDQTAARPGGELIPPLSLWVRGADDLRSAAAAPSVAVVGSRASTAYGDHVAGEISRDLAQRDVTVVSGGAFGIDAAAHRGALAADGRTWLISAAGLDRPYPTRNAPLFTHAGARGLVVSEYPPGSAPHRHRFVMRNRLIAALSTATLVVEAAARSGALNTSSHAGRLGRVVMAVPGPVTSAMSVGCHQLLRPRTGPEPAALLVTGADHVMSHLSGSAPAEPVPAVDAVRSLLDTVDPVARLVFEGLPARGRATEDQIARRCGLSAVQVMRALPTLQLAGLVRSTVEGHGINPELRS